MLLGVVCVCVAVVPFCILACDVLLRVRYWCAGACVLCVCVCVCCAVRVRCVCL